jgi:hypothetical protein
LNESAYEKSYDGLELPLGPAPVRGLKSLLFKEGRLVVPLAIPFCFFFSLWMQIRARSMETHVEDDPECWQWLNDVGFV